MYKKLVRCTVTNKTHNLPTILCVFIAHGLSFEIAFEDENESIIRKHPPKRLLRLEDQKTNAPTSMDKLQEKLDEAEVRRQQVNYSLACVSC